MVALLFSVAMISFASALVPGPVLAVAVAIGFRSPRGGFYTALGHVLTDALIILLIYFGLSQLFESEALKLWLYLLGGAITAWLGISIFRSRHKELTYERHRSGKAFAAGMLATIFNPMFWLWWATAGTMFIMTFSEHGFTGILLFILAIELPALVWYTVAGLLTYKTNSYSWGTSFRKWVTAGSGLALVAFGLFFVYTGVTMA
jgi:threonine/homoserine/homoserine lactone efflux protein